MNHVSLIGTISSKPSTKDDALTAKITTKEVALDADGKAKLVLHENTLIISDKFKNLIIEKGFQVAIEGKIVEGIVYVNDIFIL